MLDLIAFVGIVVLMLGARKDAGSWRALFDLGGEEDDDHSGAEGQRLQR